LAVGAGDTGRRRVSGALRADRRIGSSRQRERFKRPACALEGETFALIILDTLTLCALGLEENSASEMGAFFAGCAALSRATGALFGLSP
jgi:hypothetical protein